MPPSPWVWDDKSKRYRSTETGRFIGVRQMLPLRDTFVEAQKGTVDRINGRLLAREIDTGQWVREFKDLLRTTYKEEYALGIGGRNNMTASDYGRIGADLRQQYGHLYKFAEQIENGQLTEGQIRMRSRMYVDSATQAFEKGRTKSLGAPPLPAYPGDGSTQCHSNCKCSWDIQRDERRTLAYWRLGLAEHCPDCDDRSRKWAPLVSEDGGAWQGI